MTIFQAARLRILQQVAAASKDRIDVCCELAAKGKKFDEEWEQLQAEISHLLASLTRSAQMENLQPLPRIHGS